MRLAVLRDPSPADERTQLDRDAYAKAFEVTDTIDGADAVHVTNLRYAIPAIRARMAGGPPFVLTLGYDHAELARLAGKTYKAAMWATLRNWACRFAAGIIVSAYGLEKRWALRTRYRDVSVTVIPNGVPLDKFWIPVSKRTRPTCEVLAIGRLSKEKNFGNLIEAVNSLRLGSMVNLTILGEGPERLKLVSKAVSEGRYTLFPGRVSYGQVSAMLRDADVFAMPSWSEGSPKALWEAMACGLPCVVSTGVPDAKTYPCFTHEPDRIDELSARIELAISAAKGDWLRARARRVIEERHDLTKNLAEEIKFIRNVANAAG
jgi:glycosyltransferase involved in cell wall biosynthesis